MTEGIQHKLLIKLLGYNYAVEYKKGRENRAAEALSRNSNLKVLAVTLITPQWVELLQKSYEQDEYCLQLLTKFSVSPNDLPNYKIQNGIIRFKGKVVIGHSGDLKKQILLTFHDSALGGHSGERTTYQRLKLVFYWPQMKKSVVDYIQQCLVCQKNKAEHTPYPGLLQPLPIPEMAWTRISMDFVEDLPKSQGKDVILAVVDRLSKYAHFISLSHPYTAQDIVTIFLDNIFKLHGLPKVILTHRDPIFTSQIWQNLFKTLQVQLHLTTAYHPQTDGQTERVNQCLENYLRCMCFNSPKRWNYWLSLAEWWYNTSYHTSLKLTPFQALYGFPPPTVAEVGIPDCPDLSLQEQFKNRQTALQVIKDNLTKAQSRIKNQADKHRQDREFMVGDMVYLKIQPYRHTSFSAHRSLKLHSKYYGPFKVLERIGKAAYKLLLPENCLMHNVFHVSQLRSILRQQ